MARANEEVIKVVADGNANIGLEGILRGLKEKNRANQKKE